MTAHKDIQGVNITPPELLSRSDTGNWEDQWRVVSETNNNNKKKTEDASN